MHAGWGLIISVTMYAVNSAHSLLMNYYFFLGLHTALHVKVGSPIMPCSLHTTRHFGACSDGSCLRSCCSCTYTWWICLATHPEAGLRLVDVCPSLHVLQQQASGQHKQHSSKPILSILYSYILCPWNGTRTQIRPTSMYVAAYMLSDKFACFGECGCTAPLHLVHGPCCAQHATTSHCAQHAAGRLA